MFYKPEEDVFFNDGREKELLDFIRHHPRHSELKGSPEAVLAVIDEFGCTKNFLMNVGQEKGRVVADIISQQRPKTLLEIGGYVGFSAILFGNELRKAGGQKYISLEMNPEFAQVARELIALAGLDQTVEVVQGPCRESMRKIRQQGDIINPGAAFDVIFIDHFKVLYPNELKLCEELGFIAPGTTVIADNMIRPGNAQYSEYVRATPEVKKQLCDEEEAKKVDGDVSLGNPSLIYETSLIHGREPTGSDDAIEISWCKGQSV